MFSKKILSSLLLSLTLALQLSLLAIPSVSISLADPTQEQDTAAFREMSQNFEKGIEKALKDRVGTFGACFAGEGKVASCSNSSSNQTIQNLYNAREQGLIYQMVLEPISDVNTTFLAKVCHNKPLKNIAGTDYQYIQEGDDKYLILGDTVCNDFFVEKCTPNVSQTRKLIKLKENGSLDEEIETSVYCSRVQIVFGRSGADLMQSYIGDLYKFVASIGAIIAVAIIIINGIRVTVGESEISAAKDNIVRSLTALAILFLASVILNAVNPNFFKADIQEVSSPNSTDSSASDSTSSKSDSNTK